MKQTFLEAMPMKLLKNMSAFFNTAENDPNKFGSALLITVILLNFQIANDYILYQLTAAECAASGISVPQKYFLSLFLQR